MKYVCAVFAIVFGAAGFAVGTTNVGTAQTLFVFGAVTALGGIGMELLQRFADSRSNVNVRIRRRT